APARQVLGPVHAYRLGDVVVDVAVADMAERAGTGTGDRLLDHRIRLLDEIGYAGDGNGDIVLDAAAFRYLRLDDRLADPPEVLHLLLALGDHRIQHQAFLDRLGERLLHQLAEATVAPPGTGSHQCVVLVRLVERVPDTGDVLHRNFDAEARHHLEGGHLVAGREPHARQELDHAG